MIEAARREAKAAFNDDTVFLESLVSRPVISKCRSWATGKGMWFA